MPKIKLVIVDDELISRNIIKNYLKDHPVYEVVMDFSDGKSALKWLRQNDADILLCDMQMPEMNGVELMQSIHVINEFLPVIAISSFDNFDYVRGSLINGAANYLLKHELTREKLVDVLEQVVERYRIVPREHSVCRRTGYHIEDEREFTADAVRAMTESGKIVFNCNNVISLAVSPDYRFPEQGMPSEYKQAILSAVRDMLSQILGQEYPHLVYTSKDAHLIVLVSFFSVRSNLYMLNTMKNFVGRLQRRIIRMLDVTVTIIVGNIHWGVEKALEEGLRMNELLEDKLYLGGNRIVALDVANRLEYGDGDIPSRLWKQLDYDLAHGVTKDADTLNEFFRIMEKEHYRRGKVREICRRIVQMLLNGEEREAEKQILKRIDEYEIFEEFRGEVMELYHRRRDAQQKPGYSPLVSQAVEYIRENYRKEISLETCTEITGSSYTYLSRAFKQETGMRFVEYLNACRIHKAKSLLIRNELPMKEIVEQSGFRNYNYFFKVFKESEGITPSEFAAKK